MYYVILPFLELMPKLGLKCVQQNCMNVQFVNARLNAAVTHISNAKSFRFVLNIKIKRSQLFIPVKNGIDNLNPHIENV